MASTLCVRALRAQITELLTKPVSGLIISPSEDDVTIVDALIVGPEDTPYEGGLFHFDMRFPNDYPYRPPKVILLTTDGKKVRFNPNLYASGKVCLSILGTWEGPSWTPSLTLTSVLLSIQSLMNEKPYHNEPGYERQDNSASEKYNARIRYETLRVAVCANIEAVLELDGADGKNDCAVTGSRRRLASKFGRDMLRLFVKHYDTHLKMAENEAAKYDKLPFNDPFGDMTGHFNYTQLIDKLKALKDRVDQVVLEDELLDETDDESDDESVQMEGDDELE